MQKMRGDKKEKRVLLTVTIAKPLLDELRGYCKKHREVLSWFVEESIQKNLFNKQSTEMDK